MYIIYIIIIFVINNKTYSKLINNNQIKSIKVMIKFTVNNQVEVKLPTSFKELTNDYLLNVSKELNITEDRSLIALVSISTLDALAFDSTSKKKNGATVAVVPIFVKTGKTDSEVINNTKCGDKVVLSRTAIELGDHVHLTNNKITCNDIMNFINVDDNLRKALITKSFFKDNNIIGNPKVYMVDFKLVGNCDIHGAYVEPEDYENPFVNSINNSQSK